jgi:hypothetical protein
MNWAKVSAGSQFYEFIPFAGLGKWPYLRRPTLGPAVLIGLFLGS